MHLANIGFNSYIPTNKVVAAVDPDSAPIKRLVREARDEGSAIDATYGRPTRGVLITGSGHLVLSALQPQSLLGRLREADTGE